MDRRKFVGVAGSGIATGAFTEAVVTAQVAAKPPRQSGESKRSGGKHWKRSPRRESPARKRLKRTSFKSQQAGLRPQSKHVVVTTR
jgi:hypothetical protein